MKNNFYYKLKEQIIQTILKSTDYFIHTNENGTQRYYYFVKYGRVPLKRGRHYFDTFFTTLFYNILLLLENLTLDVLREFMDCKPKMF